MNLFEELEEKRSELKRDLAVFMQARARKFLSETGIAIQSVETRFLAHQRLGQTTANDVVIRDLIINLEL